MYINMKLYMCNVMWHCGIKINSAYSLLTHFLVSLKKIHSFLRGCGSLSGNDTLEAVNQVKDGLERHGVD
jgi:hypothetical protein